MSTHKAFDKICAAVIIFAMLLTILFMNGETLGLEKIVDEDAETYEGTEYFTQNDLNGDWDTSDAAQITLTGSDASISGNGAYMLDGNLVIAEAGDYVISGELTDGSLVVDTYANAKVRILLNGVTISCSDDACIRVDQADKVFLTLAEGSENVLESGTTGSEEALADGTDGIIFSHDDLTVNGSGSLRMTVGWKHGIGCNDDLVITGGTIDITAAADGIHANNTIHITGEKTALTINAADDAIHADEEIVIENGIVNISECYEGLEAVQVIVNGGDITIASTDDGINASDGSTKGMGNMGMQAGQPGGMAPGGMQAGQPGGMAPGRMQPGGTLPGGINSGEAESEELNAAGIQPGSMAPSGMQPGGTLPGGINSGEAESEELNAAGMQPGSMAPNGMQPAGMQENTGESSDETEATKPALVEINGGSVTILNENGNDADGIDSNGDIIINGGTVLVSLIGNGSNNALDYGSESGGVCKINGGTVIAAGGSSMLETISSESAQVSITYLCSQTVSNDTALQLYNSEGTEVLSQTVPYGFTAVTLSSPDLKVGETYTLQAGEESVEVTASEIVTTSGTSAGGMGQHGMARSGTHQNNRDQNDTAQNDTVQNGTDQNGTDQNGMFQGMSPGGMQMQEMNQDTAAERTETQAGSETQTAEESSENSDTSNGGMPEDMSQGQNMTFPHNGGSRSGLQTPGQNTQQESEASGSGKSLEMFDSETWTLLGASIAIMIFGLIFAAVFPRRRP